MLTRRPLGFAVALGCALAAVVPTRAWGDEPSAADVGAARQLGTEGVKLANAGKCAEAVDKLARAEKLFHAPTILVRLGECQIALGKIVEGTENLQRVIREPLGPGAPHAFVAAKQRAEKALEAAQGKAANLTVKVTAPTGADVTVTIDGTPLSSALLGAQRPTDPGDHVVEASAPGFLPAKKTVTLAPGGADSVSLALEPDPNAGRAKEGAPPPTPPGEGTEKPHAPSLAPTIGWVSIGVGTAGVVLGGAFGALVLAKRKTLDDACPDKVCPTSSRADLSSAHTMATVSTVGFVIGGVGLGAGIAILALAPSSDTTKTTGIRPFVAPGIAGVRGAF